MKDDKMIVAELKNRTTDPGHEQAVVALYRELLAAFESESPAEVTRIIDTKFQSLRSAYNDAHEALMERIGLSRQGGSVMGGFRLVSVTVKGFRGFPDRGNAFKFDFDEPCTLISGRQGGGKSSALSAIAWLLFGDKIASMSETGIEERKDWLVRNKRSGEASVEAIFEREGERIKVSRCDKKKRGQRPFYWQVNDEPLQEDEAKMRLMLGAELSDYMKGFIQSSFEV